eukprot:1998179-Lingulodinium_polyedra.AAC.1
MAGPSAAANTTMTACLARVTKIGSWFQWWTFGALEGYWAIAGGPVPRTTAAYSDGVAALLSGSFCGPLPVRDRVVADTLALQAFASQDVQGAEGHASARDASE